MTLLHLVCGLAGGLAGWGSAMAIAVAWRRRLNAALIDARHVAAHDVLTGLVNRAGWRDAAPALLTRAAGAGLRAVVLLVDLDGFKPINDQHGHAAGDALLRATAQRLVEAVGSAGLVCRLGGDEFAALLLPAEGVPPQVWAERIAVQIRRRLASPVTVADQPLTVGASVGMAVLSPGARREIDLADALARADVAMYRDKDGRRAAPVPAAGTVEGAR